MSNDLLVTLIRVGYLALLWLLVLACLSVLRRDVFGTMVTPRGRGRARSSQPNESVGSIPLVAEESAAQADPAEPPAPTNPLAQPRVENPAGMRLTVLSGPLAGTVLPLETTPIVIGRSPTCTLALRDDYASGQHARLFHNEQGWWIEDLGSRNGTFVDDERVVQARQIFNQTKFRIGSTTLQLGR